MLRVRSADLVILYNGIIPSSAFFRVHDSNHDDPEQSCCHVGFRSEFNFIKLFHLLLIAGQNKLERFRHSNYFFTSFMYHCKVINKLHSGGL